MQPIISRTGREKGREEEGAVSRPARPRNLLLIIMVTVLAVVFISAGALFAAMKLGLSTPLFGGPGEKTSGKGMEDPAFMYPFPEILVNLPEGGRRFLSVKFYLGYDEPKLEEELDKRMPEIRDVVNKILWTKTAGEMNSLEGKEKLREELLEAINAVLHSGQLRGLYFWHLLVQ